MAAMPEVIVAGAAAVETVAASEAAQLVRAVARTALSDAGLETSRVSAVFVGCGDHGATPTAEAVAVRLGLRGLGLRPPPPGADPDVGPGRVEHVAASAAEALHGAYEAVELGIDDVVLCIGLDQAPADAWPPVRVLRQRTLAARRYLNRSGLTTRHLAGVVSKNRRHGASRGVAQELTVREILADEVLDWPLTRPMVAGGGLGAAALVLAVTTSPSTASPVAGRHRPRVRMRASILVTGDVNGDSEPIAEAARLAYRRAGIAPDELDCAELADVTAAAELAAYDQLGWAVDGDAGDLVESGFTALGGVLPVNLSGGLLSLGERPGTSAIAQVAGLVGQLRGDAGPVQVAGAGAALAQSTGRPTDDAAADVVTLTVLTA
jgi:acetyl-CoA acetyltransferase